MSTRAEAVRMSRRAATVGNRHPALAARFYRRASTAFRQIGDHVSARDTSEAAEAHDYIARSRQTKRRGAA